MKWWPSERTGVLIVRVWIEGNAATGLRARITRLTDISRQEQMVSTASSIDEIEAVVRSWLKTFTGSS
jgi:hypothetical protein